MIRITAGAVEVAIPYGQSDRVHLLAPWSSVSVDPPTDLKIREGSVRHCGRRCLSGHGGARNWFVV